jgi:hypothetical protein
LPNSGIPLSDWLHHGITNVAPPKLAGPALPRSLNTASTETAGATELHRVTPGRALPQDNRRFQEPIFPQISILKVTGAGIDCQNRTLETNPGGLVAFVVWR